jgi:penicillin-binding protein 2
MRNRADNPYRLDDAAVHGTSHRAFDRQPALRIVVLFGAILVPILTIAGRMMHVQGRLSGRYAAEFDRTSERFEPIPSHDGRILATGGEILAEDREVFALNVHYRWLEDPPDARWLRGMALSRLDRQARRDPQQIAREEERVLMMRHDLWIRLSRLSGLDKAALASRRHAIQRRVEHIYDLVERRRAKSAEPGSDAVDDSKSSAESDLSWKRVWRIVVSALSTPPRREAVEPLVLREQLDYHVLLPDISTEMAVEVEGHTELYPGTRIAVATKRTYPQGDLAGHVVGYRTPLDDDAISERSQRFPRGDPLDYRAGDRTGKTGLERQYERQLRGLRGRRKLVVDRRGEVLRSETVREPRFGHDLVLSLSLPLQRSAEELLDDVLNHEHQDEVNGNLLPIPPGGAIVALDARTGAVLAMASAPRFDLRLLVEPDAQVWQKVLADSRKPLFHRAAEMALPPGSVFKVLSAIAFLESGRLDPDREFHCQGYLDDPESYRCLIYRSFGASHGNLGLVDALARSCNVYFFAAARRIGGGPILDWASRFGFGQPTGIDLPGERAGTLPVAESQGGAPPRKPRTGRRSQGDLQLAIGQGKLTATPLQVARLMAAVANGGKLVTPKLVDSAGPALVGSDGAVEAAMEAAQVHPIPDLSPRTLEWVRLGLVHVVADRQGTGYKTVRLNEVVVAGKTGTAEPGAGKPDHAWFAGYVPADRPTIAFVVVLENAGSGGHAAGPVARKFVQAMLSQGLLGAAPRPALSAK